MGKSKASINEEKTTAASYVINFYQEVQELVHNFSVYENVMLELENKYKVSDFSIDKIDDNDKNVLIDVLQKVRYSVHKAVLHFDCINENIGYEKNKNVSELYQKIKNEFVINRDDLYNIVKELNKFMIKDIMKHLLEDSQATLDNIYKE